MFVSTHILKRHSHWPLFHIHQAPDSSRLQVHSLGCSLMTGPRSATGCIPGVTFNFNALVFKPSSQDFESPKTVEQCWLPCIAVQQLPQVYLMLLQGVHPASPHHDSFSPCCTELSCLWLMLQRRCAYQPNLTQQRRRLLYQDGIDDIDSFVCVMHNVENPRRQSSLSC